jgi:hypothetical protein
MHFFGLLGSLSFFSGGVITLVVIFDKLYKIANNLQHRDITSQPLFFLALVLVIVGVQLFVTGFLAELVSRSSADRNRYLIKQRTGLE